MTQNNTSNTNNTHQIINSEKFDLITRGDFNLGFSLLLQFRTQASTLIQQLGTLKRLDTQQTLDEMIATLQVLRGVSSSVAAEKIITLSENLEKQGTIFNQINIEQSTMMLDNILQETQNLISDITLLEATHAK